MLSIGLVEKEEEEYDRGPEGFHELGLKSGAAPEWVQPRG